MANKGTTLNKEALQYLCGLVNLTATLSNSVIDDNNLQTTASFSSVKIDTLLKDLKLDLEDKINHIDRLKKLVVNTLPTSNIDLDTLYLLKKTDDSGNEYFEQYLYMNSSWEILGTTKLAEDAGIKIYDPAIQYTPKEVVLYKGLSSHYNMYICTTATTGEFNINHWEITNGNKITVEPNADNIPSDYRLDITQPDGTVLTTNNLHGIDNVQVNNGLFQVYIENGNAYVIVNNGVTPPPLSLENGKLYYTMNGTIKYTSVEYDVTP